VRHDVGDFMRHDPADEVLTVFLEKVHIVIRQIPLGARLSGAVSPEAKLDANFRDRDATPSTARPRHELPSVVLHAPLEVLASA
jgi:hypothetical protein